MSNGRECLRDYFLYSIAHIAKTFVRLPEDWGGEGLGKKATLLKVFDRSKTDCHRLVFAGDVLIVQVVDVRLHSCTCTFLSGGS